MAGEGEGGLHRNWGCGGGGEVPRGENGGGDRFMEGGGAASQLSHICRRFGRLFDRTAGVGKVKRWLLGERRGEQVWWFGRKRNGSGKSSTCK